MRSWLFVPGDSERKLARAGEAGAGALILDLEDSVAAGRRVVARGMVREFLGGDRSAWVRINPLEGEEGLRDLAGVMPGGPAGVVLPKATPGGLERLDRYLEALEVAHGWERGGTRVMAIATESAAGVFGMGGYGGVSGRLAALTWGAEDLAAVLGAVNREEDGRYGDVFRLARGLCLLGAQAAGVAAVDTVFVDFRDEAGLRAECVAGRRAGFVGKMAIHPGQVGVIEAAFAPSSEEVAWARAVVAAFEAAPGAGVVSVEGRMVDRPHWVLARRVLGGAG